MEDLLARVEAYVLGRAQTIALNLKIPNLRIPDSTVSQVRDKVYVHLYSENRIPFSIEIRRTDIQPNCLSSSSFGQAIDRQIRDHFASFRRYDATHTKSRRIEPSILSIALGFAGAVVIGFGVHLVTEFVKLRDDYYDFRMNMSRSVWDTRRDVMDHYEVLENVWSLMINDTKVRTMKETDDISWLTALGRVVDEKSNLVSMTSVDRDEIIGRAAIIWSSIGLAGTGIVVE